jgi:4-hydroxythreonine-4-phosphate dehydrogenase
MMDVESAGMQPEQLDQRSRPRIALSMGDANGIGPEVVLKCISDPRLQRMMRPVVVGSIEVLRAHARAMGFEAIQFAPYSPSADLDVGAAIPVLDMAAESDGAVDFGAVTATAGKLAMRSVEAAVQLCLAGDADAMVTAPISKKAISLGGYSSPGHTEFIAGLCGSSDFTMMMVADRLRIALVTGHMPVWDVPRHVRKSDILRRLRVVDASLRNDFGIPRPRIAVLALNPHAGEEGILGKEEMNTISPTLDQAKAEGMLVFGPFPADGFFGASSYLKFDAVLAMYHDQGLIPFKTLAFESGVNFTAGLPIVRTSPDHGTAYDIAGQGRASPESMRSAVYLAVDVARRRTVVSS